MDDIYTYCGISNHYIVYLKLIPRYMSIISQKTIKNRKKEAVS